MKKNCVVIVFLPEVGARMLISHVAYKLKCTEFPKRTNILFSHSDSTNAADFDAFDFLSSLSSPGHGVTPAATLSAHVPPPLSQLTHPHPARYWRETGRFAIDLPYYFLLACQYVISDCSSHVKLFRKSPASTK